MTHRAGWLVRLETEAGLAGHGDCAPLPEAGSETAEAALACLERAAPLLCGSAPDEALGRFGEAAERAPAARCALETALLDLLAQQAGLPLARWLNPRAPLTFEANAMLGGLEGDVAGLAAAALAEGFSILKLKVGLAAPEIELERLRRLAAGLPPGARLRLDANGAWNMEQAKRFIGGLAGLPVESLEEPLAHPEIALLRQLQALAPFPLAIDESLRNLGAEGVLAEAAARRLVLKPMALGGVRPSFALAKSAERAGIECVVTSAVDSAVGVLAAAHLAAALGNGLAHGVATSSWLLSNVGNAPQLEFSRIDLDNGMNGLGFDGGLA